MKIESDLRKYMRKGMKMLEFDKEALIRLVAKNADFTIGDIRIIFETIENCIYDIAKNGNKLRWHRVMQLYVKDIEPYEGWNPIEKKRMVVPAHKRIYIKPSKVLHNFVNDFETIEIEDEIDE